MVSNPTRKTLNGVNYVVFTLGDFKVRKGVRNGFFVVDKTMTATGFSGIENTDWTNILGILL